LLLLEAPVRPINNNEEDGRRRFPLGEAGDERALFERFVDEVTMGEEGVKLGDDTEESDDVAVDDVAVVVVEDTDDDSGDVAEGDVEMEIMSLLLFVLFVVLLRR